MPRKPAGNQKQVVQVGPFEGGLNNISLSGEARDSEVVDLVNMEVTVDTALTSRPPIEAIANSTLPSTNTIGWEVLGIYRVDSTEWHLIVTVPKDGTTNTDTTVKAYLNGVIGTGETVTTIKQSVGLVNRVTSMVQFKDKLFFNVDNGASDTGFYWKKGDAVGGTAVASMPKGNVMISWKTRLWVSGSGNSVNGDRVYFSTIDGTGPHPETWGAADFFDVAPGEGGFITALVPSFNNLIVFKNDGTWRFSFPSKPAQGVVDKISGDVGCAGKNAVVDFENYMYVYDQGRVYELVNSNFTQINRFVKFDQDPLGVDAVAGGVELSVVNRRVLVRYFNALYCFTVDSKAWSQWRTYNGTPGRFYALPGDSNVSAPSTYIASSRGTLQSVSTNQIEDASFNNAAINAVRSAVYNAAITFPGSGAVRIEKGTAPDNPTMYLNQSGVATDYDIPVSTSQKFNLSFNVDSVDFRTATPRRTNKTRNPRIAIDLTDVGANGGGGTPTLSRVATGGPTYTPAFARATAAGSYTYMQLTQGSASTNLVTPGLPYSSAISLRAGYANTAVNLYMQWVDAGGAVISTDTTVFNPATLNTWQSFVTPSYTAPANAVRVGFLARVMGSVVSGNTLDGTEFALIENSNLGNSFFTGANAPSSVVTYEWTGAVDASTSIERWVPDKLIPTITYYLSNGSTSVDNTFEVTATGAVSKDYTAPAGAILANVSLYLKANEGGRDIQISSIMFKRSSATSPFNMMRIMDQYPDQAAAVEYIDCYFQSKSYDYKTPGNFKRLFWAGIDVKTSRTVKTEIRPVSRIAPVSWGDLENYSWAQLEQGKWGNPLSWLNVSSAVFNILEADEVMSENGRYFKKLGKALRFRQISYVVRMSSFGNKVTGPVKFFSLTTTIATKQDVVDSST